MIPLLLLLIPGAEPAPSVAIHAVVRVTSHGGSATVIETGPGRSRLLSCAHAFQGGQRSRPIVFDAPHPSPSQSQPVRIRLIAIDSTADLSLLELDAGPLPYVCPVAPAGHRACSILSIGYDEMRLPARQDRATIIMSQGLLTFTRERPWHGRSGGALIDAEQGLLLGVVQGYELGGERRGLHASHAAILRFLQVSRSSPALPMIPSPT